MFRSTHHKSSKSPKGGAIIAIIGLIASGKTTLCQQLKQLYPHLIVMEEAVLRYPYMKEYYQNPQKYAMPLQQFALNERYKQYCNAMQCAQKPMKNIVVLDHCLYADMAYAHANKENIGDRFEEYEKQKNKLLKTTTPPDVTIFLDCTPGRCKDRIRSRGRVSEKSIPLSYLQRLECVYKKEWMSFMKTQPTKLVVLDWNHKKSEDTQRMEDVKKLYEVYIKPLI